MKIEINKEDFAEVFRTWPPSIVEMLGENPFAPEEEREIADDIKELAKAALDKAIGAALSRRLLKARAKAMFDQVWQEAHDPSENKVNQG